MVAFQGWRILPINEEAPDGTMVDGGEVWAADLNLGPGGDIRIVLKRCPEWEGSLWLARIGEPTLDPFQSSEGPQLGPFPDKEEALDVVPVLIREWACYIRVMADEMEDMANILDETKEWHGKLEELEDVVDSLIDDLPQTGTDAVVDLETWRRSRGR